jgi:hypothetical protein
MMGALPKLTGIVQRTDLAEFANLLHVDQLKGLKFVNGSAHAHDAVVIALRQL